MKFLIKTCDWLFANKKNVDTITPLEAFEIVGCAYGLFIIVTCKIFLSARQWQIFTGYLAYIKFAIVLLLIIITFQLTSQYIQKFYLKYRPLWFNKYVTNEKSSKYITFKNQQLENYRLQQYVKQHPSNYNYLDI